MANDKAIISSSFSSLFTFHVFLSFRGKDTRKNFTDHLYTALVNAGLRTFQDDNGIERGENVKLELEKAIEQSRCSIIVFSKRYVSSRWCLDELEMILERRRTSGLVVLPVFYDVTPAYLRKQNGFVGKAFARHKIRHTVEKVKGWKAALKEVADIGGMVLQNQTDGRESKFIQKVVKVITDKLNRTALSIEPCLVGIDSRVDDINLWLQCRSATAGIVIICGIGGIGKTTTAKYAYNLNFERFEASSFLLNIRENSIHEKGLIRLQRQLLSDVLGRKEEKISCIDEGVMKIREFIRCKRVLLVLDDVDRVHQLDALLGMRDWFCPGSKIIITTRRERLIKVNDVDMVYKVQQLSNSESFELFRWHAFGRDDLTVGYMEHFKRAIDYCQGLPLALRVLGSSLSGKSLDGWKSALQKLVDIPDSEILSKLKISYDSLQDDHDRNLFLYIACFFVGEDKEFAVEILDRCHFYTVVGIENLIDRCLLTIDENNKLMMHQLVQEMGREIIRQESPKEPGKRSLLCHHMDSLDVLRERIGTERIEGLVLDMRKLAEGNSSRQHNISNFGIPLDASVRTSNEVSLEVDAFAKMQNLRLLQLNCVKLNGNCGAFPRRLRWLNWRGFPLEFVPNDFPLGSLVALDIQHSNLKQIWKGSKVLGLLKFLNLSHCHCLTKTPDFTGLKNLSRLILKDCVRLVTVHASIGYLHRLALLNLKGCKNLRRLPRNIGMARSLETLIISGCSRLDELPVELTMLESLKMLHADGIAMDQLFSTKDRIKSWQLFCSFSPKLGEMEKMSQFPLPRFLLSLSLVNCNLSNESFPKDLNNLFCLQNLNLSKNPLCSLPDWVRSLTRLRSLRLNYCTRLQSLTMLPRVEKLFVGHCTSLEKITYLSPSFIAKQTEHTDCNRLTYVEGLWKSIHEIDPKTICYWSLFDSESTKKRVVNFFNSITLADDKIPIQVLYQRGVSSTFFLGNQVPAWFKIRSSEPSIALKVPLLPHFTIQHIRVCTSYTISKNQIVDSEPLLSATISNKSKNLTWMYAPTCFGVPEGAEDMLWLSCWKNMENLLNLEAGDEVNVSVAVGNRFKLKEFGLDVVYEHESKETKANNNIYKKYVNGTYYHASQVSTCMCFVSSEVLERDDVMLPIPRIECDNHLLMDSSKLEPTGTKNGLLEAGGTGINNINDDYLREQKQIVVVSHILAL